MPSMRFSSPYDPPIVRPRRLRGQVHCHWFDDFDRIPGTSGPLKPLGKFSVLPRQLEQRYHSLGYDFIVVTEHNSHPECYVTPDEGCPNGVSCLIPPTGEELDPPVFTHMIDGEEITPGEKHVLALGIDGCILREEADDSMRIHQIAKLAIDRGGVAFMPHPGASIHAGDLLENITLTG
jgi:hypothetical protein